MWILILLAIGFVVGLFSGVLLTCLVVASDNKDDDFS